ncbi:hypothetical protein ACP4OV_013475 [Aristida adscensionis]
MQQGPSAGAGKNAKAFKRELLRNLLLRLRARTAACPFAAMSLQERRRAVKSSADLAMAAARGAGARWPRAILAAGDGAAAGAAASSGHSACKARSGRCKRVVRRCRVHWKRRGCVTAADGAAAASSAAGDIARRLVKRRTMALRKVIPGGDAAVDEASLLREAMDYVVHLRAQVDVLRRVSEAVQRSSLLRDPWPQRAITEEESSARKW